MVAVLDGYDQMDIFLNFLRVLELLLSILSSYHCFFNHFLNGRYSVCTTLPSRL